MTTEEHSERTPPELLSTGSSGQPIELEDLIDEGLDGVFADRIPELRRLAKNGNPADQLSAARVLTAWGVHEGFQRLVAWASEPQEAPWADSPVIIDRFYGADASFEALADAVYSSFWNDRSPELRSDQLGALRALLAVSRTHYVGSMLALAVVRDRELMAKLGNSVRDAVDYGTRAVEQGDTRSFDRALQTAALIMPLAMVDDRLAADYARRLLRSTRLTFRSLRELAQSLGAGTGRNTLAVLQHLSNDQASPAAGEVAAALSRRKGRPQ